MIINSTTQRVKPAAIADVSVANDANIVFAEVTSESICIGIGTGIKRSGNGRMSAIVAFLGLVLLLFTSCNNAIIKDPFVYLNDDFAFLVEGKIDETEISAEIRSNYEENSNNSRIVIVFLNPQPIKDIIISINKGRATARLGEIYTNDPELIELADPFLCLCNKQEIHSIQRSSDGETEVKVTGDDADLVFTFRDAEKYPTRVCGTYHGRAVNFTIKGLKPLE